MRIADAALSADGGCDRRAELLGAGDQLLLRARDHHPAADDEQRPLGCDQQLGGLGDRCPVRAVPARRILIQARVAPDIGFVDHLALHIIGKADVRRARPARGHLLERIAQHPRDVGAAVEHRIPLGQGPEQGLLVEFGERVPAPRRHRNVGGEAQHRDGGLVRFDDAGEDVGRAAAARSFTHADTAGHARIAVGHIGGRALVAGKNVLHPMIQPVHRVVERQRRVAAQAEDVFYPMQLQHAHEGFATGDLGHAELFSFIRSESSLLSRISPIGHTRRARNCPVPAACRRPVRSPRQPACFLPRDPATPPRNPGAGA